MADDRRPEGLETKDTRGALLSYQPSVVPHTSRTGSQLTNEERERADNRLRDDATSVDEAEHHKAQFSPLGIQRDSGGVQPSPGITKQTAKRASGGKPASSGGESSTSQS